MDERPAITGDRPATDWAVPEPEISSVAIEMTHGELAVLALGLSEMSTHEQRAHAREVLHGWVSQAFDAIAEEIIHGRK